MAGATAKRSPRGKKKPKSSRDKVRAYRKRMRAMGLRPVTIWVPDSRSKKFEDEIRRQARAIARSDAESDDQAFIDAISEPWPE
jgi:hypothetical protein